MSRKRIVIHRHAAPPPAPPPPAPPKPSAGARLADSVVALMVVALIIIGAVAVLRLADAASRPAPGWVCWDTVRSTSDGREREHHCSPAPGWHLWQSPSAGWVSVPDDAIPPRRWRYYVRGALAD